MSAMSPQDFGGPSVAMDPIDILLQLPALGRDAIPPGADTSMTTSSPDQAWFIVVTILSTIVPAFFLALRIYTKVSVVKALELADYFLFLAFPLLVAEIGVGSQLVKWGAGVHQWRVTLDQIFQQLYWANVGQVIYCPLSYLVKMAILLQYLRLFAPNRSINRVMWWGAWFTMITTSIMYFIFMFWTLFSCTPRRKIWFKLIPDGHCHSVSTIVLSQGAFNMITDLIVLILPTCSLWQLKVPRTKRITISMLFGTGLLACIASLMRIIFTLKIDEDLSKADVSYNDLFIGLWTQAEVSLGFIVACSLSLPKLIQTKGHKFRHSISKASFSPFSTRSNVERQGERIEPNPSRGQIHYQAVGFSEDLEAQNYATIAKLQPVQRVRDAYALPSPLESTEYSHSMYSQGSSCPCHDEQHHADPIYIVSPEIMRSISTASREVPIRWDRMSMPPLPTPKTPITPLLPVMEESMDERSLDERSLDERSLDERGFEKQSFDERSQDERSLDQRSIDEGSPVERLLNERTPDQILLSETLEQRSLAQRSLAHLSVAQLSVSPLSSTRRSLDEMSMDEISLEEPSPIERLLEARSVDLRSFKATPLDERPQDRRSLDERSTDERLLDEEPLEEEPSVEQTRLLPALPELSFGAFDLSFHSESWTAPRL